MKARILAIIAFALLMAATAGATDGPINFTDNRPIITYESGYYFLTISEVQTTISSQTINGWVKMRLNLQNGPLNAKWDMVAAGLTSGVKTTNTAGGKYMYFADKGFLVTFTDYSLNYFGCGFSPGTDASLIQSVTATTASITTLDPVESMPITLTRANGTAGDITGTWNFALGPNVGSMTFNKDGTFTAVFNIVLCID